MIFLQRLNLGRSFLALVAMALAAGCTTPGLTDPARSGPVYKPTNFTGVPNLPSDLRRVLLLPLSGAGVATPEMSAAFEPVFIAALQKENRFEVVALSRAECRRKFGFEEISSVAALPRDLLTRLKQDLSVDGVLFVDLTAVNAYRPLAIGVRAKLASVEEGLLLWSFDTMFSAADAAVANSARRHMLKQDRSAVPADLSPAVLQSPSRFADYVAGAMFATLPPVFSPPKNDTISR
jgi:hypothetical protein